MTLIDDTNRYRKTAALIPCTHAGRPTVGPGRVTAIRDGSGGTGAAGLTSLMAESAFGPASKADGVCAADSIRPGGPDRPVAVYAPYQ